MLSIIFLSFESSSLIRQSIHKTVEVLQSEDIEFEIIVVDDGSQDNSFLIAKEIAAADKRIRPFQLSKNYGSPAAFFAGLSLAKGACVTSIPDDLQRPPELLVELYRTWQSGNKLVIPFREERHDPVLSKLWSTVYYRIMNKCSSVEFPKGGTDSFLADREIVDVLVNQISPINTSPTLEVLQLGFSPVFIPYARKGVLGKSRWTFKKRIKLAFDTFFSTSVIPLRVITFLGLTVFLAALASTISIFFLHTYSERTIFGLSVPGWASTVSILLIFNGLFLFCLGILSEYMWRIYQEVKSRPSYVIKKSDDDSDRYEPASSSKKELGSTSK